ncbi:MAG: UMP kinase [Thermoplasmata archaeon]
MDTIVVSVGGSILIQNKDDITFLRKLAKVLIGQSTKHRLFVVTGGGRMAREYIRIGRELGASESYLDELGIEVTRLNARLLITAIGDRCYHVPARTIEEAIHAGKSHPIVVMGGLHPGFTTDAVSAMIAERVGASRLVNATAVQGVFTSDPKKDPKAKLIPKMTYDELIATVDRSEHAAGPNVIFDPLAARIVKRAKIETVVCNGRNLKVLMNAIEGEEVVGTVIKG